MPHVGEDGDLLRALWDEWPSFLGFGMSFVMIGIMWLNHKTMFKDIERLDHTAAVLNLLLLMAVSFVPFPTAVLAEYLEDDRHRLVATLLYGGSSFGSAIFFNALWIYASFGHRLIDRHVGQMRLNQRTRRYLLGPLFYGLTLPLAFISPWISVGIFVALGLLYLLPLSEDFGLVSEDIQEPHRH